MESENNKVGGDGASELILGKEVYQIVGSAFEVLNELGHGGKEKIYENSLVVEFRRRGIAFTQQQRFPVAYKGENVGVLVPDLIAYDAVIVDTKVVPEITAREIGQMINYLKITQLHVGVILNFFKPRLEWERIVL